ncbi:MAG: magnesium and cobalt transport protein CorA, partial [Acidobacteriota bacterium]
MSRRHRRRKLRSDRISRRSSPGTAPGTLVVDPQAPRPVIDVIAYGPEKVIEKRLDDPEAVRPIVAAHPVTWVNVTGLGDASVISRIGEIFELHRLALEDVVNVHQRAKVEQYKDNLFIVIREISPEDRLSTEQLSIFLGKNFLVTFQEQPGDPFDPVRERIRKSTGRIRHTGPDQLAYALIDATIDHYFPVLERYGERIESLEDDVIVNPDRRLVALIHEMRHGLLTLRRAAWPLRETVNVLYREPLPLISDETRIYLRDCYDHTVQIIDLLENYRDVAS